MANTSNSSPTAQPMARNLALWLILILFFGATSVVRGTDIQPPPGSDVVFSGRPVPKLAGRVTDTADVLKDDERERIEQMLEAYERETFHQIAVLTVPTLAGEDIESYALRVSDEWKLGHKGVDNGILVILAMKDKRMRIELGYGMSKFISDDEAKAVIENQMIPAFKIGDFG